MESNQGLLGSVIIVPECTEKMQYVEMYVGIISTKVPPAADGLMACAVIYSNYWVTTGNYSYCPNYCQFQITAYSVMNYIAHKMHNTKEKDSIPSSPLSREKD